MHGTLDSLCRVEWRPLAALADMAGPWRDLAHSAASPNVFYHPAFALAAAPHLGRHVTVGLVWSRQSPSRLVGLFPMQRTWWGYRGWTHPYAPLGMPLIDREMIEPAVAAWCGAIADAVVMLPMLPLDNSVTAAMTRHMKAVHDFDRHGRACLAPSHAGRDYLTQSLGAKARKELPRKRRRLAERGTLTRETGLDMAAFFALEASGWKGRAGTAAARDPDIRMFMQAAVDGLAQDGQARVDLLKLDNRPIAALVTLGAAERLSTWKIAYDEDFARYSPGVQIVADLTEDVLRDSPAAIVDSCATADHPMIGHVWRERLVLADRMMSARNDICFATATAAETLRRKAREQAKRLRDRLRGG